MFSTSFVRIAVAGLAICAALAPPPATAQGTNWPTKPVKLVVPFPPGGSVDPLARLLAVRLSESMGQQFIVENKPGASGSIGTAFVAKSAPDGYNFIVVFDTHAVNPTLIPNMPFDTLKDLAPIMLVGTAPMAVATNPAKPYKTFADVTNAAKAKPDTISYGTVGNGSLGHLTMTLVQQAGGFKVIHVPYGQVDLAVGSVAVLAQHVRSGKLRAIAVTGDKRSHTMPDVPALSEQGFPGFSALAWWGVLAPAGTPKPILDKFHAELVKALNLPDLRKTLTEQLGMDLVVSTPDGLQKFIAAEVARWGKVVRDNNIRAD
ncbi:MAG: tripartite tricarboxylate transporter substrate binding protein [Proteobacteria bacterium]|nr:tripartite tricarboxylate transporter substrate binding protein [Pseudomonadota bacterium]